ncbi:MAG: tRNA pseudouridine(55) synthase TruB [Nitrospirae bacterium]|nr:tRNA pseudouridine(55) synthase TruB [Nitrospirota bacterium]
MTSYKLVERVKSALHLKKAGHAGTLDPLATGVMLILADSATRFAQYFLGLDKEYIFTIQTGIETDTLDREGKVTAEHPAPFLSEEDIKRVLKSFIGVTLQKPPMYSALKYNGEKLYDLARRGEEVEREFREINISELEFLEYNRPFIKLRTVCSKGTYVRTLCADISEKLGTVGHVVELRRTRVGRFLARGDDSMEFFSIDEALGHFPEMNVSKKEGKILHAGMKIRRDDILINGYIRIKNSIGLMGVGSVAGSEIKMETRVF